MRLKFAGGICALLLAGWATLGTGIAADRRPSLVGATREEVLAKLGEPKSQIVAGSREVMLFAQERVFLREGRVVEVEPLPVEPARPVPPPPAASAQGTNAAETATSSAPVAPAEPRTEAQPSETPAVAAPVEGTEPASVPVAPPEPEVQIKSIRSPRERARTLPPPSTSATSPAVTAAAPSVPVQPSSAAAVEPPVAPATTPSPANVSESLPAPAPTPPHNAPESSAASTEQSSHEEPTRAAVAPMPESQAQPQDEVDVVVDSVFTGRTYAIAAIIIVGGIGYLVWRRRQRQLELAATAVSRSPFVTSTPVAASGARFTAELLGKLEWKRFEELVAAYYNKTGVVAVRTKTGPDSPVHVRISWKGEQRPFACVACVARPSGLVDVRPVQALSEALGAEDIRRGYVVTSGRFSVPARDLAEEKHLTLLAGDAFLEKLNALPEPARAELLREASAGDYTAATCPKCDLKMNRTPDDMWQCVQCGAVLIKG